jgi:hypothetical protein
MLQKECTHIEDDLPDDVLVWQIFLVEVHMSYTAKIVKP